jgi:serine/threonine protein kinase
MSSSDPDPWFEAFRQGLHEDDEERAGIPSAGPSPASNEVPNVPRYSIGERIGEGAAAVVYRAWDRELGRPVALKILRETAAVHRSLRARFHREAKIAAGLSHPNVVSIYDVGESEGRPFLVMELVEGGSFAERIADPELPLDRKCRLLEKAARGVAWAHAKGIVHRDLKPANILVDRSEEPKVGDFGLSLEAEMESRLTQTGVPLGTPAYMSPEQVRGESDLSSRTDVYALGAILYEILTGRTPHRGDSLPALYRSILESEPELPGQLCPEVPRPAEAMALKALRKNPSERYENAAEFAEELSRFLRGEAVLARPPSFLHEARARLRARPSGRRLLAGFLVFSAVSVGLGLTGPTVEHQRKMLSSAVARGFDGESARLLERAKGLQPIRLIAALQAASEPGREATPPEEIRELLDYELRKLQLEPEFFALVGKQGQIIYSRGPAALLDSLRKVRAGQGRVFAIAKGRLWILEGTLVRDTIPENEGVERGTRWIGESLDASVLFKTMEGDLGEVAWTGPDGAVLGGGRLSLAPHPGSFDAAALAVGGGPFQVFSEDLPGAIDPIRQHLLVRIRGGRTVAFFGSTALAGLSLLGLLVLFVRPRAPRDVRPVPARTR